MAADRARRSQGTSEFDYPSGMTPDGKTLVFLRSSSASNFDVFVMPIAEPAKATPLVQTPAYEGGARLSADGRWLVHVSNESGRNEIYERPFPGPDRRWQVSTDRRRHAARVEPERQRGVLPQRRHDDGGRPVGQRHRHCAVTPQQLVKDESTAGRLRMILNWSPAAPRGIPAQ